MATKETIVSAIHALTDDEFLPSALADNSALETLVAEYFGGNDDTDNESVWSDDEEIRRFPNNKISTITVLFVGPAPMEEGSVPLIEGISYNYKTIHT